MIKKYPLTLLILFVSLTSFAQTYEDIENLRLTDTQMRNSFQKRRIILTNLDNQKKKAIKEGAYAKIKLKEDTTRMDVILEAFLSDSIIVSKLKPIVQKKQIRLVFNGYKVIPMQQVEMIEYSLKHQRRNYWAGYLSTLFGVEFVVLPLVMPALVGDMETYKDPMIPKVVGSGIILTFIGFKLLKSGFPKEFYLTEWQYRIVQN